MAENLFSLGPPALRRGCLIALSFLFSASVACSSPPGAGSPTAAPASPSSAPAQAATISPSGAETPANTLGKAASPPAPPGSPAALASPGSGTAPRPAGSPAAPSASPPRTAPFPLPPATSPAPAGAPASPSPAATRPNASPSPSAGSSALPAAGAAPGPPEHDGDRALAHVQALAGTIGERVAGSPEEATAARYIQEQFASSGYDVEVMPFTFQGNVFITGTVAGAGDPVTGFALPGSAPGQATGPGAFVGLADEAGLAGQNLTGKVAVADRGTVRFGQKLDNVRSAGAVALVVINNAPGFFIGVLGKIVDVPVVGVRQAEGDRVRAAARSGAPLTVTVPTGARGQGTNVIARPRPGARCDILVGGHYDSVPGTPGANDNASGLANVIEVARAFAAAGRPAGLCFAAFSGEESGLHGSLALADRLRTEGTLPRYMLNLDVTGRGSGIEVIGSDQPSRVALDAARRLSMTAQAARLPEGTGSDFESFDRVGVPVVYLSSGDFSTMHTPDDTADRIDPATLDRIGDLAFATIEALRAQG